MMRRLVLLCLIPLLALAAPAAEPQGQEEMSRLAGEIETAVSGRQ